MTEMSFEPGTKVELMEYGKWTGEAHTVTAHVGRTPDHLVLMTSKGNLFELYNDAPYNVRPYQEAKGQVPCQCEHILHFQKPRTVHEHLKVPAGESCAMLIGPICDACVEHMRDYLLTGAEAQRSREAVTKMYHDQEESSGD